MQKHIKLDIRQVKEISELAKALASEERVNILNLLNNGCFNIIEIAKVLNMPISSTALHINVLSKAGLIYTELQPGQRGASKVCSKKFNSLEICFDSIERRNLDKCIYISMPIGGYTDCNISPLCGMVSETGYIESENSPRGFFDTGRFMAQLIWFHKGYLKYRFPNKIKGIGKITSIDISFEVCSEAPNYRNNWPSDITVWIDNIEIGTWTCPGDFGGRKGNLNPSWWPDVNTQFGLLKHWSIEANGAFIDGERVESNGLNIGNLKLDEHDFIDVKIGVKDDAVNIGGINLFGEKFGDFSQNIVMRLEYIDSKP